MATWPDWPKSETGAVPMASKDNQSELFEEITLRSHPLRIRHARIPVAKIKFDPANPRLKYLKEIHPDKTDSQLLFADKETNSLLQDIKANGLLDPIYVKQDNGEFVCVEGNRRTACFMQLRGLEPDNPKFLDMPARILPSDTTEDQTSLLMASFHIAGKVKWDAHEKAGHIYHMLNILHIPEEELKTILHMGAPRIRQEAESYRILQEVYRTIDNGVFAAEAGDKWSFFSEMLKIKPLRERHQRESDWDERFSRWVGEGRIPRAEDVRELPSIFANHRANNTFLTHKPITEAFQKARGEADEANPENRSDFYRLLKRFNSALRSASLDDMTFAQGNDAAKAMILDAYNSLGEVIDRSGLRSTTPSRRIA
jgi:ParB/Sulfiredoxin domain